MSSQPSQRKAVAASKSNSPKTLEQVMLMYGHSGLRCIVIGNKVFLETEVGKDRYCWQVTDNAVVPCTVAQA